MKYDSKTEKVVACVAGCGRKISVGKFKSNRQFCQKCKSETSDSLPKLTNSVQRPEDSARSAIFGTPDNPRATLESIQRALSTIGFSPSHDGSWTITIGTVDGGIARASVDIDIGLPTMPDPHISRVSITTQSVMSVVQAVSSETVPTDIRNALDSLQNMLSSSPLHVVGRQAKHVIMRKCSRCGLDTPEFLVLGASTLCTNCSGRRKRP